MGVSYYFTQKEMQEAAQIDSRAAVCDLIQNSDFANMLNQEELSLHRVILKGSRVKALDAGLCRAYFLKLQDYADQIQHTLPEIIMFAPIENDQPPRFFSGSSEVYINGIFCRVTHGRCVNQITDPVEYRKGYFCVRSSNGEIDFWQEAERKLVLGNQQFEILVTTAYKEICTDISECLTLFTEAADQNKSISFASA